MHRIKPVRQVVRPHQLHHGQVSIFAGTHDRGVVDKGINAAVHATKINAGPFQMRLQQVGERMIDKLTKGFCAAKKSKIGLLKIALRAAKENPRHAISARFI